MGGRATRVHVAVPCAWHLPRSKWGNDALSFTKVVQTERNIGKTGLHVFTYCRGAAYLMQR